MGHTGIIYLKGGGSMCQAINKHRIAFVLLSTAIVLNGCLLHYSIGPGYNVYIKVADNKILTTNDVNFFDETITACGFINKRITPSDTWECANFIRDHPQIQVGYCYDKGQHMPNSIQNISRLRFVIGNDWKGQEPKLKEEIDNFGDVFYEKLIARFGKENVKIENRRTGPPF